MESIKKLQESLNSNQCAVILSPHNRFYFTQMESSDGLLIVSRQKAELFIDFRYIEAAQKNCSNLISVILKQKDDLFYIEQFVRENKISIVLTEGDFINALFYLSLSEKLKGIADIEAELGILSKLRDIKSLKQLDKIKAAQEITDKAFAELLNEIHSGISERQLKSSLIYLLYKYGADGLAFEPIVVSGENSSLPHGTSTDRIITAGDFITMDFGAVKDGWCSDMTRTVAVEYADDKHIKVYDTVLKAQQLAMAQVKAGALCSDVDKAARQFIYDSGYEGYFGHSTGHGVGVLVHESPNVSPKNQSPLKAGNVITIEPGIYLDNRFGCRIENMVYVLENGYENLTKSPTELFIVK